VRKSRSNILETVFLVAADSGTPLCPEIPFLCRPTFNVNEGEMQFTSSVLDGCMPQTDLGLCRPRHFLPALLQLHVKTMCL
jgi:hypothetical protein